MLSEFHDPPALLAFLRSDAHPERKNDVLRALVLARRDDDTIADVAFTLLCLGLWPGLDALRGRLLRHFRGQVDELDAEILARFADQVGRVRLDRVQRIAATLLRNVERDIRRDLSRQWSREKVTTDDDPDGPVAAASVVLPIPAAGGALERLAFLVGRDAPLVWLVVVGGCSQKEAAVVLGISHDAARKRFQRSMIELRARLELSSEALSQSAPPGGVSRSGPRGSGSPDRRMP